MAYAFKHKTIVHKLDFVGVILQGKVNNRVFVNLDSIYADYNPSYSSYFGRDLILLKSVYVMNNSGKLFSDELTEWLVEAGFIQYQWHMYIFFKYATDGKNFVLPYVHDCVYWYTS